MQRLIENVTTATSSILEENAELKSLLSLLPHPLIAEAADAMGPEGGKHVAPFEPSSSRPPELEDRNAVEPPTPFSLAQDLAEMNFLASSAV